MADTATAVEQDRETRLLLYAAVSSAALLALGWILSLPALHLPPVVPVVVYLACYVTGGTLRLRDGLVALRGGRLNIDTLMVVGAAGAAVLGRWNEGSVLIVLFAASNALEAYAAGRTRDSIRSLMTLRPDSALVRRPDGREEVVAVDALEPQDIVLVRPGERLSADGVVLDGHSSSDESSLTGESMPVDKAPGAPVFAGTLNGSGLLVVEVTRPASESTLARTIRLVEEAQEHKAEAQRLTEWIDRYYTLGVVGVALSAFLVPPLALGRPWPHSFYVGMQLLVVMSPCALVIATPAALLAAIAAGARRGVLFKGGRHLEAAGRVRVVAIDKTGTLTEGRPVVRTLVPAPGHGEEELLRLAAAAECRSPHPLAQAVVAAAQLRGITTPLVDDVQDRPGHGVVAVVGGQEVRVGSRRLMSEGALPWLAAQAAALGDRGETAVLVDVDGEPLGAIGVGDLVRDGAGDLVDSLRAAGMDRVVMLTGDNERVAAAVAGRVGLDEFRAGLLPEGKIAAVRDLERDYGPVAMVGDGVNDAPALAAASLGVAMGGAGNDAALDTADMVLMTNNLRQLAAAFRLGRRARRVVAQNLTFAVGVIVTLVSLTLSGHLTLPLAVVGHEGSTMLVALNGLRLLVAGSPRPAEQGKGAPVSVRAAGAGRRRVAGRSADVARSRRV